MTSVIDGTIFEMIDGVATIGVIEETAGRIKTG
jgi:hypothetical protein